MNAEVPTPHAEMPPPRSRVVGRKRRKADLGVLRTDAKVPPRARALAILEHDVVLLISPGNKKIKSLAELKKKKIAVFADDDTSVAFLRNILEIPDGAEGSRLRMAP